MIVTLSDQEWSPSSDADQNSPMYEQWGSTATDRDTNAQESNIPFGASETTYAITLEVSSGGKVALNGTEYSKGTHEINVTTTDLLLNAISDNTHIFSSWKVKDSTKGTMTNLSVKITNGDVIYANFTKLANDTTKLKFTLEIEECGTGGQVYDEKRYLTYYSGKYNFEVSSNNATAKYSAKPGTGYRTSMWSLNGTNTTEENNPSFTITQDLAIKVKFAALGEGAQAFTFGLEVKEGGKVIYNNITYGPGAYTFMESTKGNLNKTFEAVSDSTHLFSSWKVNTSTKGTMTNLSVKITNGDVIYANFTKLANDTTKLKFSLDIGVGGTGAQVYVEGIGLTYYSGKYNFEVSSDKAAVTYEVGPGDGYRTSMWKLNGVNATEENNPSFTITQNLAIKLEFAKVTGQRITFGLDVEEGGEVIYNNITYGPGTHTFLEDTDRNLNKAFKAVPDEVHSFEKWTGVTSESNEASAVFEVKHDLNICANFASLPGIKLKLTLNIEEGGYVLYKVGDREFKRYSSEVLFMENSSISLEAHANYGYTFKEISTPVATYTESEVSMENIATSLVVDVRFNAPPGAGVKLTLNVGEGGYAEYSVNGGEFKKYSSEVTFSKNANITLKAYANGGYEFKEWSTSAGTFTTSEKSFTNVTSSLAVDVKFSKESEGGSEGESEEGSEGGSDFPWIWVGVAVLLVLIILAALWFLRGRSGKIGGSSP